MRFVHFAVLSFLTIAGAASAAEQPVGQSTLGAKQTFTDKVKMRFWGNYSGPQISSIKNGYTTDPWGSTDKRAQNVDDLLTLGYQVTPDLRPGVGMPFNLYPAINTRFEMKPLYFGIIDTTIVKSGDFSMHADLRFYTPIGEVADRLDVKTGIRSTQVSIYDVAGTPLSIGLVTYVRMWVYGPNGKGFRPDLELYVSPFAKYRLAKGFYATLWTDVLQLTHEYGKPGGLSNLPVDVQPGVRWDITDWVNVNPYVNIIPASASPDRWNLGLVVNVAII